jgi:predicted nucleic acid-binding protein
MSRLVVLDTGPLGLLTNPKRTPETVAAAEWAIRLSAAGHRLLVPAIADYEVRRELVRARQTRGLAHLDAFIAARPGRFLSVTDSSLRLAADLWPRARNAGTPTADAKELDCDVLIAAQAIEAAGPSSDFVIATANLGHLGQFAPAELWSKLGP